MYWGKTPPRAIRSPRLSDAVVGAADRTASLAAEKLARLTEADPDFFPLYTKAGRWRHDDPAWTNWCEGFLGGQLWWLARLRPDDGWATRARHYTDLVGHRRWDRNVHDLGFVLAPTWRQRLEVDEDHDSERVLLDGAATLAERFNRQGGYLRSFLAPESVFIDIMMNVGLIAWAAARTGDEALHEIARTHCATTRRHLVRGDGSVAHEGIFDLQTGEFLRQSTQQGWRSDSAWARGQAWSIYGFTAMHQLTGERQWLDTALLNVEFWLERTGEDPVPPNDFDEPDPPRRWESSAAACTAAALFTLAATVPSEDHAARLLRHAEATITRLCSKEFLAHDTAWDGVLRHGTYHERLGLGVDESVMWGDYFLIEAIARILL